MVLVMGYLPRGVYDTFVEYLYRRRIARMDRAVVSAAPAQSSAHKWITPSIPPAGTSSGSPGCLTT